MSQWVRICAAQEAPKPGELLEAEAAGVSLCLANIDGHLSALDNLCPHRGGPLGGGWIDNNAVVCPWHCWAFDTATGIAAPPEHAKVAVFPLRIEGEDLLVDLS